MKLLRTTLALALAMISSTAFAGILVKSGEKIAFLGDSITQAGWDNPKGYVHLVVEGLAVNGVTVEAVPAGISGHKSNDMLGRLERDVTSKKPNWMTLSCGVNDVWHGANGVNLVDYKKNITAILDKAAAAKVRVVVTTATVIKEDLNSAENVKLAPYNAFLRTLATQRRAPLAEINALFQARIKAANQPGKNVFTSDGVHMNPEGDKIMASAILKAFGLDHMQMKKAEDKWAGK